MFFSKTVLFLKMRQTLDDITVGISVLVWMYTCSVTAGKRKLFRFFLWLSTGTRLFHRLKNDLKTRIGTICLIIAILKYRHCTSPTEESTLTFFGLYVDIDELYFKTTSPFVQRHINKACILLWITTAFS